MIHWYAFQSKARKERFLCEQLQIREIDVFFPSIRVQSEKSGVHRLRPYFPGYVFGHVDLEISGRSNVDWIPGAVRIVGFGGEPAPVPDYLIDFFRQHLESIHVNSTARDLEFQRGDVVAIQQGPFAGYEGIFNSRLPGRDRVEVLLKMLQDSHIRVELSIEEIKLQKP